MTKVGSESTKQIIFELKGSKDKVFEEKQSQTINDETYEYSLSDSVSRVIPQILEYRRNLEMKPLGDPDLQKSGIEGKADIEKCIIVVGKRKDDDRWKVNFKELKNALASNIEIWTYSDLQDKLDSTILNLEADLNNFKK